MNISQYFTASLVLFTASVSASNWYEGGTLTNVGALEWQVATYQNKLASSADVVALMYQKNMLNSAIASSINSVDDLKPHAIELSTCIEAATKADPDPKKNKNMYANQTVNTFAALCVLTMGWGK